MFFIPKNEVHDRVGQLQPGALNVGKHMAEREQKAEIFRAHDPERYIGEANKEVHPKIAGMMQIITRSFPNCVSATCAIWQG